jgi:hypothetical protein
VDALLHTELAAARGVSEGVVPERVDEVAIDLTHPRPDRGDRAFPRGGTVASHA